MDLYDDLDAAGKEWLSQFNNRASAKGAPKPKKRGTPERDAQRAVVSWLRKAGCIVQATFTEQAAASRDPNARARFGAARKASGATTGFPDLTVVMPNGRICFIEMKSAKGVLSDHQKMIHDDLRGRGAVVILGRDVYSVQDALAEHGITMLRHLSLAAPVQPLAEGV